MVRLPRLALGASLLLVAITAHAWSRPGHMVTAAIAYEELAAQHPQVIARIDEILTKHPDRAAFEVAVGSAKGEERARRLFMQMARWPDDARSTLHDHPTWHYAGKALADPRDPPPSLPDRLSGAALEAFVLSAKVASDRNAPASERAVALCWIFHLTGDLHQPLHAVDQFSRRLPAGDRGGGLQFVKDAAGSDAQSLHSFWDGLVPGSGDAAEAIASANVLRARFPRAGFKQLSVSSTDVGSWHRESVKLAETVGYPITLQTVASAQDAKELAPAYVADARATGERQLALAGYRLSDLLRALIQ